MKRSDGLSEIALDEPRPTMRLINGLWQDGSMCNAESPIHKGDTGPVTCRLKAGHDGAHVATSIEPQDRYNGCERSWSDSPRSVPHRG